MEYRSEASGWDELSREIIRTVGVPMMQKVADACNLELVKSAIPRGTKRGKARTSATARARNVLDIGKGYMVSVEGDERLELHDFRATVITASGAAIHHNAKNQTLLRNFHLAKLSGEGDA